MFSYFLTCKTDSLIKSLQPTACHYLDLHMAKRPWSILDSCDCFQ